MQGHHNIVERRANQDNIGGLDRNLRPCPDGNANVGPSKGHRIIDPISNDRHSPGQIAAGTSPFLQSSDKVGLLFRSTAGGHILDSDLSCDSLGGQLMIAGAHPDIDTHALKSSDRRSRFGID